MARIDLMPSTKSVGGLVRLAALFGIVYMAMTVFIATIPGSGDDFDVFDAVKVLVVSAAFGVVVGRLTRSQRRPYSPDA